MEFHAGFRPLNQILPNNEKQQKVRYLFHWASADDVTYYVNIFLPYREPWLYFEAAIKTFFTPE